MRRVVLGTLFLAMILPVGAAAKGPKEIEYAAILLDGKKIGHTIHTRKVEDSKVRTSEVMNMQISRSGITMKVSTSETCIETIKGEPIGFETEQVISGIKQTSSGTITPDGKIDLTVTMMGIPQKKTMDWPKGALLFEGMRLVELDRKLIKGLSYNVSVFSPSLLAAIEANVTVGDKEDVDLFGRVVKLTKMTVVMKVPSAGEMPTISYVDEDLNALKTVMQMMGMNFEILSCDKEFALSADDVVDFLDRMFVQSPRSLGELDPTSGLVYTLAINEGSKPNFPSDDHQTVKELPDGRIQVTVRPVKAAAKVKFPYRGKDESLLEALKPTMYLQSDSDQVRKLVKEAVGREKDAAAAAKKIEKFVGNYISNKNLSIGYATAAEVAENRQGDCTEHAVLTAAILRAAGIPARVAVGLVYVEEYTGQQHVFGGHAWTQANIGGQWIGLDATRADTGFDGGYITLATGNGDPQDFFGMVTTLGYFTIEEVKSVE